MEDVQTLLNKYKLRVKRWELDFKKKHNRKPSKHDIKEARPEIKYAYKKYYQLTTSMLVDENILDDDEFNNDSMDDFSIFASQSNLNASALDMSTSSMVFGESPSFSNISQLLTEKIQIVNPIVENDDGRRNDFEAEESLKQNETAWGDHLEKRVPKGKAAEKPQSPLKLFDKLKDKMLPSLSFKMRHPRKSFTKNRSQASQSSDYNSEKELFPDFETVLRQKSQKESLKTVPEETETKESEKTGQQLQLDSHWLDRVSADCVESPSMASVTPTSAVMPPVDRATSFGISKLAISDSKKAVETETAIESDHSVISNSEDESTSFHSQILKRRRLSQIDEQVTKTTIPEENQEAINPVPENRRNSRSSRTAIKYSHLFDEESVADPFAASSEDEDFVPSEEDEKKKKTKPARKKKEKVKEAKEKEKEKTKTKEKKNSPKGTTGKRKSNPRTSTEGAAKAAEEENNDPKEYLPPIDVLTDVVPRLATTDLKRTSEKFYNFLAEETPSTATVAIASKAAAASKGVPISLAERKANEAKERLLKKIASGTLNENFVRIDITKKIYVKGKKTGQFRREKMKKWRHIKKVNAMSGPDMNMGGCDGGLLTCFQCGGIGHFAQNCKVRTDNLLPVEVVDDSPFMSLEEAEKLAEERRLLAHAHRPETIPSAASGGYKTGMEGGGDGGVEDSSSDDEEEEEGVSGEELDNDGGEMEDGEATGGAGSDKNYVWEDMDEKILLQAPSYIGHKIPEDFLAKSGVLSQTTEKEDRVKPLYSLNPDGSLPATPPEVFTALKQFGHTGFRFGQEEAVMRILCGKSTLVTLATGSGKSLCYQLPAYLYRQQYKQCITLVVSPLVSLMEDQVHGVPGFLNAQCLNTNQTEKVRNTVLALIKAGKVDVLLLSPEAIVAGEKSTGFGQILKQLPPIAFVCVDEAHCVSQWSHNFRPSYLMVCRVLREKLGIEIVLGLTATATAQTRASIIRQLAIPDGDKGVISDTPLPDNLILTVSKDKQRDRALVDMLRSERFSSCSSIIVYCTRRDDCDRIAGLLRTSLQKFGEKSTEQMEKEGAKKRKRGLAGGELVAESYHAGMAAGRRRTIQNAFMRGDLRIVVATIAFGMGINKSDIRAVIHYNMPKSFEGYVQEVGRAGRDGELAHCHLFLDGTDKTELRRHIYGNSIDRHVIRKLLQKVFVPCVCGASRTCPGHEVAFSVESTVQLLDIPEENIATLLCYLELDAQHNIQVLSKGYTMCKVLSYAGPGQLKQAAKNCPPLAMAIALDLKRNVNHDTSTFIEFPVVDIASSIGWDSGVVKYNLKKLEWVERVGQTSQRSKISVSFFDLGFRIRAPGNLTDDQLDAALEYLSERVTKQEKAEIIQLHNVFSGLYEVAHDSYHAVKGKNLNLERTDCLKLTIRSYFQNESFDGDEYERIIEEDKGEKLPGQLGEISNDIFTLISRYPENNFTGRAIARIFHGIASPNYPPVIWGRCKFWRAHLSADFKTIIQTANSIILQLRTQ